MVIPKLSIIHTNREITSVILPEKFSDKIAWIMVDDGKKKRLFYEGKDR